MESPSSSGIWRRLFLAAVIAAIPLAAVNFYWVSAAGEAPPSIELALLWLLSVVAVMTFGLLSGWGNAAPVPPLTAPSPDSNPPAPSSDGAVTEAGKMPALKQDAHLEQAEQALRDSESRLRGVVDMAVDAIITIDEYGTIETVNPAVVSMFGYDADEMVGRNVKMLMPAPYLLEHDTYLSNYRATGENRIIGIGREVTARRKDGTTFPTDLAVSEFCAGGQRMFTGILRDITARQASEHKLRDSHALLQTVVEGITDPIYVKDLEGRYVLVNRAFADSLEKQPQRVIGADDEELFGAAAGHTRQERDRRALASGFPQTFEEMLAAPDFPRIYLSTLAPVHDRDGRAVRLLGISRDITSQKRMEQSARDNERHVRKVLDSLLVFVAVMTPNGIVTGINNAVRREMASRGGRGADGVIGSPLSESLSWTDAQARAVLAAAIARAAGGTAARLDELRLLNGENAVVADVMIAPMSDNSGKVTHLILSAIEISERIRAEERTREQQAELAHLDRVRTMGQMAAGLAHELRQPLAAITNYAGATSALADAGRVSPETLTGNLAEITAEAARAAEIITRLRSMVKKQSPAGRPCDVNELVNEVVRLLSYDLRNANISPRLELADGLPAAWVDVVQIQQVLVNLIQNAIDAMEPLAIADRSLTLRTLAIADSMVEVSVIDNGCGVPEENMDRIFKSFFTTKANGMGMGLALCRTILEDHSGNLAAIRNPQRGMTFSFTLRVSQEKAC